MKKSFIESCMILSLAFLLCFAVSCQQKGEEATTVAESTAGEELKAKVRQEIDEAWNNGSLDVLDEFYSADFVYHVPPQPDIVGLEAYKQFIIENRIAYPDLKLTIKEIIVEGDTLAMRWTYEGTQDGPSPTLGIPATGKHVTFSGCVVGHQVDGKIVETWNYVDWLGLLTQLGFTITPPTFPEEK
ncbi:MAG: ester cyclase [Candidatus Aminicenantes bacterium]|nr:ester cyclase [Candidatus Aminicenantes bacterium]